MKLRKYAKCLDYILGAVLFFGGSMAYGQSRTYTLDADFDEGSLLNVNHDAPNNDQLQLNATTTPFPFINVAASARGTIIRIDVNTGAILGEYRSAPEGRGTDPSRTTVDLAGNVWAGNRAEGGLIEGVAHGSAVKVGLIVGGTRANGDGTPNPVGDYLAPPYSYNTCVDRDGDGLIKTSRGLGDTRPWPDVTDGAGGATALVEDADDECILIYQRVSGAPAVRHVSVDANNDAWVGGYPFALRMFHKLDGSTGAVLASFDANAFGCGGYGGLVDANGILWSASISHGRLLRYDPGTGTGMCIPVSLSYGLGLDTGGFIWHSMWTNNSIVKISPAGVIVAGFPKGTGGAGNDRGVAVTPADDHVWVANSGGADVSRLDNAGNVLQVIPVGNTPTGVAVDANGKVWSTNLSSDNVSRIDPNGGGPGIAAVDLTVGLGPGAGPYNYSDMTGSVLLTAVQQGTWTVVYDTGTSGTTGCTISWTSDEPAGTSVGVEVRAADSPADLPSQVFVPVTNGGATGVTGRYLEIQATLSRDPGVNDTPILYDLTIQCNEPPDCSAASAGPSQLWPPNHNFVPIVILGVTDPDGDPIAITIDSIFQDERVRQSGGGAGNSAPDGEGVGTATANVRAERNGNPKTPGNGRVYHIGFTADDGNGGTCIGSVLVCVPHDQRPGASCVDGGALYDSTTP